MIRLVQLKHPTHGRRAAMVDENKLRLLNGVDSVCQLAELSLSRNASLAQTILNSLAAESLDYDPVYQGKSDWRLLPPFDHPKEPARCLVTGTGLTHKKSADNRQSMHTATATVSDSMRMYQWGLEGGRRSASSPNGFSRAPAQFCAPTANRSKSPVRAGWRRGGRSGRRLPD